MKTSSINTLGVGIAVIDCDGTVVDCDLNIAIRAGFKSIKQCLGLHYSDMQCDAAQYYTDFLEQDRLLLTGETEINFISTYKYADNQYHSYLIKKVIEEQEGGKYIRGYHFDVTPFINPLLCELLSLYSKKSSADKERSFWYRLDRTQETTSVLTQQEIYCIRSLIRNSSSKMIARDLNISVRTVEGHLNNIRSKLNLKSKHAILGHCLEHRLLPLDALFS